MNVGPSPPLLRHHVVEVLLLLACGALILASIVISFW
jgi:hypothetical protein